MFRKEERPIAEISARLGRGIRWLRSLTMRQRNRFRVLVAEERGVSGYISFLYLLVVALFVGSAAQALYGAAAARAVVTRAATAVAQTEAADGCFSERAARVLGAEIAGGGLRRHDVAVEAANWAGTSYGKTVRVLLGYNYRVRVFGQSTPWWIHLQAAAAAPSQFMPGAEPGGVCVGETGARGLFPGPFTGIGREDVAVTAAVPAVTGPGPGEAVPAVSPLPAAAVSLRARPEQVSVGQTVYVSGEVTVDGRPAAGAAVLLTYPGGERLLFSPDGEFGARIRLYRPGIAVVSASAGGSPVTATVTVKPAEPAFLAVSLPSIATVGEPVYLDGEVLEEDGRAAMGVGSIAFRCSPEGNPAAGSIPVVAGRFGVALSFAQPGVHRVVLRTGRLSEVRSVAVDPRAPTGIRLLGPTRATAGEAFAVEIRLEGEPGESTVRLFSPTDPSSVPPESLAVPGREGTVRIEFRAAGSQLLVARVDGVETTALVRVGPGEPAEFRGLRLWPERPRAGGTLLIAGGLRDRYGNPVADGTPVIVREGERETEAPTLGGGFSLTVPAGRAGAGSLLISSGGAEQRLTFTVRRVRRPPLLLTATEAGPVRVGRPIPVLADLAGPPISARERTVVLTVYSDGGRRRLRAAAGPDGRARFTVTPDAAGPLFLSARARGYAAGYLFRWVAPGRPAAILGLGCPPGPAGTELPVTAILVDRWGDLLDGVDVRARGAGAAASGKSVRGLVRLGIVPRLAGLRTIRLQAGDISAAIRVEISSGPPAAVRDLPPVIYSVAGEPPALTGRLVDAFGNGVPREGLRAFIPGGGAWTAVTDDGGRFSLPLSPAPAAAGTFPLRMAAGGWEATVAELRVLPGEPARAELNGVSAPRTAGTAFAVWGRVSDRYGNPVADGTPVRVVWPGGGSGAVSTEGGAFRLELSFRRAGDRSLSVLAGGDSRTVWRGWLMVSPGPPAAFADLGFQAWTEYGTGVHGFLVTGRLTDAYGNPEPAGTPVFLQAPGWTGPKAIYVQEFPYDFWTPGGFDSETNYGWTEGPVVLSAGTVRQTVGWL